MVAVVRNFSVPRCVTPRSDRWIDSRVGSNHPLERTLARCRCSKRWFKPFKPGGDTGVHKETPGAGVALEQLDHRRLLSVNFTGNVASDFPATQVPGVVVLKDNPTVIHPLIPPVISPLVKVSGFDINGIRLSYDAVDDILSIGLEQPLSQQPSHPGPVIAGDADNNGNSATVDPAVQALEPQFIDFADLGGTETMGAFLSLTSSGSPDVVAGISGDPNGSKVYQVAQAVVNPVTPGFGTPLPQNTGNVFLVNDPAHPNFEFNIDHFSQLFLAETGKALTPETTFKVGAFGNSDDDDGISEAFFPGQTVKFSDLIAPPACPPQSPKILINPHSHRHINTAHPDLIRVNVFGTSGFDMSKIEPDTVRLGGASPVFSFNRHINRDEWLDATFVFKGTDVTLPPGVIEAEVTGQLTDGTTFDSSEQVFNRDRSFYTPAQLSAAAARQARRANAGSDVPLAQTTQPLRLTSIDPTDNTTSPRLRHRARLAALQSADTMAQSLAS